MHKITSIDQIETGDVMLISTSGFLPGAIQWFQGNKYNHAGMFVWVWNKLFIVEAQQQGVNMNPFERDYIANKHGEIKVLKPIIKFTEAEKRELSIMCADLTDRGYDYTSLLFFDAVRFLYKKITGKGRWYGRKAHKAAKRMTCGEFVAYVYARMRNYFSNLWFKISPGEIDDTTNGDEPFFTGHMLDEKMYENEKHQED